ncbi:MAG: cytochrome c-type biogenesis CcmF C-terminal domain-containing protein, partial [Bacteroidota bacterium]
MFGQILIHLLFGTALVTTASYFVSLKKGEVFQMVGRNMYRLFAALMVLASGWLLYNILTHNFQYSYIWGHSSRDLPLNLLIATFYSGQEGSFMLWAFFTTMIGLALLPYVRRHKYESEVMSFFSLILVFLALMLVAKNPFAYVWETFASDPGIYEGFTPAVGRGLNPLLHNGWITIHPPILFIGFASMAVPFAFAMGALLKRSFHEWIDVALPWTLFATAVLGFGIMLGGFWAYESLGWGGFWGWDPVENSSLIPWLAAVALVHTMIVQKKTKGLVKTNFTIAIFAYLLVLYSTFLTRSGVLGDTSVHSFVEPGMFAKMLLIAFVAIFAVLGIAMILLRRRDISVEKKEFAPASREFFLSIGAALTLASAIIITLGTSWPVIAEFIGQPKVAVDVSFYNTMHLPLVIAILLTNAASLLLKWRMSSKEDAFKKSFLALGLAIVATAISFVLGVREIGYMLLTFAAWFSLFINAELALKIMRGNPKFIGAYVSHAGIALLMLGIVATAGYSQLTHAQLVQGETVEALGYKLTFLGREQVEKEFTDKEKYKYHIRVEKGDFKTTISPVLFWSDFNKRQSAFLEPGIKWSLKEDLYISPKSTETEDNLN